MSPIVNVYFRKPGKGKIVEKTYFPRSLQFSDVVADNILFLHAFSSCDTASCLFNRGKIKFFNLLEKNKSLSNLIQIFKDENADSEDIISAGENFFYNNSLFTPREQLQEKENTHEALARTKCITCTELSYNHS
jgi:hypothetical protein